jgi:Tol biopolymer transport system component
MGTQKTVPSSVEREVNRQALTCVGVVGLAGCVLVVLLGVLVGPMIPKDIGGYFDRLLQGPGKDGIGQIAFVSTRDGNPEIYIISTDGSGAARLTDDPAGDFHPAWSPDGTRIAFYSERDGNAEIYVMNADGSDVTRLTQDPANDFDPAWSPDGTQITFHSHRFLGAARIFVMNADGSGVVCLTDPNWDDWSPAWSPDGTQILFNSSRYNNRDIWLMGADGSKMTNLTANPADDWWPAWSPDGSQIVFHSDRDGGFDIYSMNKDGSEVIRLTASSALEYDPAWSSDGKFIALTSDRAGNRDVWIMNADGSGATNLTAHPAHDWAPAWRPDGSSHAGQPPSSVPAGATALLDHYRRFGYEFGWSGGAANEYEERKTVFYDVTSVVSNNNNIQITYAWRSGVLYGTLQGNILRGTWIQDNGRGNFELTFSSGFSSAEGWWDEGGIHEKHPAFIRSTG